MSLFEYDIASFAFDAKKKWFGAETFEWLNTDYDFSDEKGLIARLGMINAAEQRMNFILKVIPYERSSKPIRKMANYVEIVCLDTLKPTNMPILPIHSITGKCRVFDSGLCGFPMLKFYGEIMETCSYIITPEYKFSLRAYLKDETLQEEDKIDMEKMYAMLLLGVKKYQDDFKINMNDLHLDNILIHKLPEPRLITIDEFRFETEYIPIIWDFELANSPTIRNLLGDIGIGNIPLGDFVPEYDVHLCTRELFWNIDKKSDLAMAILQLFPEDSLFANTQGESGDFCETISQCKCYGEISYTLPEGASRSDYNAMLKEIRDEEEARLALECLNPASGCMRDERMLISEITSRRGTELCMPTAHQILNHELFEKYKK